MHTTVFEYGYLTSQEVDQTVLKTSRISENAYNYLKEVCLGSEEGSVGKCLNLTKRYGYELIQVKNYVGVLFTPTGEHIEVLPKIGIKKENSKLSVEESREMLLMMLQHLGSFRHVSTNQANIASKKMPLLEVFINQFLQAVNSLVKKGLKSDYVTQVENLNYKKGKLLTAQQVKHNLVNKHKFYVEYDEYLINRPANRLIKTALQKLTRYVMLASNQKLLRELQFAFVEVPESKFIKQDINAVKLDRGMLDYHVPLAWAKLILDGFSPLSMKGDHGAISLLFPMEAVFESYVASVLREQLIEGASLTAQACSEYLVTHNKRSQFQLKPDLLITKQDNPLIVLDTKWKLIDLDEYHYGISQADLYQMFAYGQKYLGGEGDLFLIYPAHEDFTKPIEYSFNFSNSLKLWVVPFISDLQGKSRLIWPETFSFD
ncbi:McrC family protein [Vibrio diabolicus]|uniref:McrC family protein n=1 Tax=Vibrio diabolicus TaxID=50719 RepID=UPI00215C6F02|nr:McrC family protein [Vibrio diabolicus]MCR9303069.1 McrC family protein [Vibrio diabolicus]MCR9427283.1 McrC family protein [Vibrio diabolicus]MCS0365557.1 McrC family protein [Vibrio diabolicus]